MFSLVFTDKNKLINQESGNFYKGYYKWFLLFTLLINTNFGINQVYLLRVFHQIKKTS